MVNTYIDNICKPANITPNCLLLPLQFNGSQYNQDYDILFPDFKSMYHNQYLTSKEGNAVHWYGYIYCRYIAPDQRQAMFLLLEVLDAKFDDYRSLQYDRLLHYIKYQVRQSYNGTLYFPIPLWETICHIEYLEMYLLDNSIDAKLIDNKKKS